MCFVTKKKTQFIGSFFCYSFLRFSFSQINVNNKHFDYFLNMLVFIYKLKFVLEIFFIIKIPLFTERVGRA
jgi:hypothetical protein